jgi:geranylgeranyl diphosphate synthase, type II
MPVETVDRARQELEFESSRVSAEIDALFGRLLAPRDDGRDQLFAAMRHAAIGGGKRLRPLLTVAGSRLFGIDGERALRVGAAIEAIHVYSLIHDDLPCMDDDDMRRGKPTCHKVFGENVAILAGDGLYAEAFALLLSEQQGEPANVLAAARELAQATGVRGMVGGQYIDVAETAPAGPDGLRRLHELKTGKLIAASVSCVLELGGNLERETISGFRAFASELGVLFQIVDDILDVAGSEQTLGKPQGSDERLGKRTYVTEFGLQGARRLAAESRERARAALFRAAGEQGAELAQITDFIATRSY